ncbi:acyl-CoA dehydrogenase [Massilia sp. TSP1-1-2]|uniref:acyl-CoA dehydrogenase n=1 Tax=unclassified Massilia TaxID=2609279 RepID=UPI003CF4AB56
MITDSSWNHAPATLSKQDSEAIAAHAAASDQTGMLAPELQALLHARGWLSMLAPAAAGGAEMALPDAVRLEEAIASVDGSTGWLVTLCAGAGWFGGYLAPDFARDVIGTPAVCVGGSGAPTGYAEREGDGYRLSGRWDIATGTPMATHFTLNAMLRERGVPLLDRNGAPRVRAFIVPAVNVQVHPSWHSIGLRATASHSFSMDGVWVAARHAFDIAPDHATAPGPLYRFPFLTLAFVTLAANVAGMALHFLRLAGPLIARRRHPLSGCLLGELPAVVEVIREQEHSVAEARAHFYRLLDNMWSAVCANAPVDAGVLNAASLALVDAARHAVDTLYPYCGLYAADQRSDIGRVWRDLHTATQHAMLVPLPTAPAQTSQHIRAIENGLVQAV